MKGQGVTAHKQILNLGGVERGKQISEVGIGRHRPPAIRSIPWSGSESLNSTRLLTCADGEPVSSSGLARACGEVAALLDLSVRVLLFR